MQVVVVVSGGRGVEGGVCTGFGCCQIIIYALVRRCVEWSGIQWRGACV